MNIVMEKDSFVLALLDKDLIVKIQNITTDIENIGAFFSTKINTTQHWINKLDANELWTKKSGYLALVDKETSKPFGVIWNFSHAIDNSYEIGINIFDNKFQGKGIGAEALSSYCHYLFLTYPINRLQYNMIEENLASEKIAKKVGFVYEGTQRKALFIRGKWKNLKLYSLLREECNL